MLFDIYLFALVVGGILLVASVVMGGEADTDADADLDLDLEADADADGHGPADGAGSPAGLFTAFFSIRFWTFFLAFFGITGLVFDGLDLVEGEVVPLVLAIVMGLVTGFVTVMVLRSLHNSASGHVATSEAYVGKSGRVLTRFGRDELGKIRIELGGTSVDVLARTDDNEPFASGDEALIVEMQGHTASVARLAPPPASD